jgi:hypothetical protein
VDVYAQTMDKWRKAGENGDAATVAECLADDVVAISPLTDRFRFNGRAEVAEMLAAAFACIKDIRYHTEVGDGDTRVLFFHARAGREPLEEAELLRLDADGLVRELTFFGRPLPAVTRVMADIAPRLLRAQGRPSTAGFISLATKPLAAMTRLGDSRLVPLADPARRVR